MIIYSKDRPIPIGTYRDNTSYNQTYTRKSLKKRQSIAQKSMVTKRHQSNPPCGK